MTDQPDAISPDAKLLWHAIGSQSPQELADLWLAGRGKIAALVNSALADKLAAAHAKKVSDEHGIFLVLVELSKLQRAGDSQATAALQVLFDLAEELRGPGAGDKLAAQRLSLAEPARATDASSGAEKAKVELRDDLVGIEWLAGGDAAARAVCFISVLEFQGGAKTGEMVGTGFLVSEDRRHIMTALHVPHARQPGTVPSPGDLEKQLTELRVSFDFLTSDDVGTQSKGARIVACGSALDYAILELPTPVDREPLTLFAGQLVIGNEFGLCANIIQHPMRGKEPQPKQLGLRNNAIWRIDTEKLYYFTDTRAGSSGSPVLSDGWQVYAVHTGWDATKPISYVGRNFAFANRGALMSKVIPHVRAQHPGLKLRVA